MNIFVVHKGSDYEAVKSQVDKIKAKSSRPLNFLVLHEDRKLWKRRAKKLMERADIAVYFEGRDGSDNIAWELQNLEKLGKPIYVARLCEDACKKEYLYTADGYEEKPKYESFSADRFNDVMDMERKSLAEKLFSEHTDDKLLLLEQYKMLLQTSENLIGRRQQTTNVYLTIASIIIPIISSMIAVNNVWINLASIVISVSSVILCWSWIKIIASYGKSNAAKFAILEEIEKKLPASMFGAEWFARKEYGRKYKSFTDRECTTPKIFILLDFLFIIIALVLAVLRLMQVISA